MGGASSTPSDGTSPQIARDLRLLLGNFDRLDPMTQRLVSLGKKCLTSTILDSQQNNFKRLEEFNAEASGAPLQVLLGGAEAGAEAAGSTATGSDNCSPVDFESYSFEDTTRCHKVTEQKQYRAKDFYPLLKSSLPSDGHCVLGLVWTDLYPEDDLNFTQESHKDITEVDGFLVWTLIQAISHELCHLFGQRHCTYFHCSMNESTSLVEAMDQPLFLCPVCLRKLHEVCRFDVLDRYQQMLGFLLELQTQLPSVHCDKAIVWLQNCISFLQQPASATGN
ncbi:archaemetzincin-2-like [Haliotis rufescens]|uniref:archaemetzincin-2-like n=1 Tax=Haliotis rufescens TaxID=6454 RepID=UPI00201F8169|nr:archaemetzincin-2-like [Haliotis rufescens]